MKPSIYITTFLLFISQFSFSQDYKWELKISKKEEKQFGSYEKALAHKQNYFKKAEKLGIGYKNPDVFYQFKVNLNKIDELKAESIDIIEMTKKIGYYDYKESTLVSDIVVIGTIIKREYDSDENSYFHSIYTLQVKETLKGKKLPETLIIKQRSGVVGELYLSDNNESPLNIGENVLIYLRYIPEAYQNIGDLDESTFYVENKFTIKSDYVFDKFKTKVGQIDSIKNKVNNINTINNSDEFYNTTF